MDGPLLEADRGQVSLITLRDEVIRQFRFHDPSKNLPFTSSAGSRAAVTRGHCSMMRGGSSDEDGEVDGDEDGGEDESDEDGDVATNSCRPLLGVASGVISW